MYFLQKIQKITTIFLIVFLFCFCSVQNENNEIYSGVYDESFYYQEFTPAIKIDLIWDSLYVGRGSDSIDIDLDGIFDVVIIQNINQFKNYNGISGPYSSYRLHFKEDIEIAIIRETFYVGLGQTSDKDWVDTVSVNTSINNLNFGTSKNHTKLMWSDNPAAMLSSGPWSKITDSVKYIGIRKRQESSYKFGWIKAKIITKDTVIFESCAIEK